MVTETLEAVVQMIIDYRRESRSHPVPVGGTDSVFSGN